jgi:hypothetical protein
VGTFPTRTRPVGTLKAMALGLVFPQIPLFPSKMREKFLDEKERIGDEKQIHGRGGNSGNTGNSIVNNIVTDIDLIDSKGVPTAVPTDQTGGNRYRGRSSPGRRAAESQNPGQDLLVRAQVRLCDELELYPDSVHSYSAAAIPRAMKCCLVLRGSKKLSGPAWGPV